MEAARRSAPPHGTVSRTTVSCAATTQQPVNPDKGLITCRTAADFQVEDCLALDEHSQQIKQSPAGGQSPAGARGCRQFRVRSPRRGGHALVGAWVRIRIDCDLKSSQQTAPNTRLAPLEGPHSLEVLFTRMLPISAFGVVQRQQNRSL